jgi:carboxyl-terminal processing protease
MEGLEVRSYVEASNQVEVSVMKRIWRWTIFMIAGFALTACGGFLPLDNEVEAGTFGPAYQPEEHQSRTFDTLWTHIEDTYIYYETADVDWETIESRYSQRIETGLSNQEFISLLDELEGDLPEGSFLHQPRSERIEADLTDASTYDGIGAFIGFQEAEEPHIVILAVIEGSPAEAAGLKAHDSIFSIDSDPILLEEGLNAVNRIRGAAGSSVTLTVQSPGEERKQLEVERAKLTSTGKLETDVITGTNIGYLLFPPIGYEGIEQDIYESLQGMTASRELGGLILDLRIANSSRGWPLETLFSMFHGDAIGELYNRNQEQVVQVEAQDVFGSQSVPLVILIGENTSGFPEVFAASLQMNKRATLVGSPTSGDVETQSSFYLPDGSRIFVESTSFRLTNGTEIGQQGVTPDIPVEGGWDEVLPENDPVLDEAIEFLETDS